MNKRFSVKFSTVAHYVATAVIITSVVGEEILNWTSDLVIELDMAPNSVDDQFIGCEEQMYKLVKNTILPQELKINKNFSNLWEQFKNTSNYEERIIKVYTSNDIYKQFNNAVSNSKNNYITEFNYKAFHFLLTRAIQNRPVKKCTYVYRRTNVKFNKNVLNRQMRFGSFASASFDKNLIQFGNISCFKIKTCFGADISKISVISNEKEVLIPPFETFKITSIKENEKKMKCNVRYTLKSIANLSCMNCVLFN